MSRSIDEGRQVRRRTRELAVAILDGFKCNDLLTYSSAISFQILTAIIPFVLFVLAVAGLLHLTNFWQHHLEPQIRANVSGAVFTVVSDGVNKVFSGKQWLWATFGGGLALWQISGAVRAVMGALQRIYGAPRERPFRKRYSVSFILSIEVGACFIAAGVCLLLAPFVTGVHDGTAWGIVSFLVRWVLTVTFLALAVGMLVRHAPGEAQTVSWVSLGAGIIIASWIVVSLAFYLYLTDVASYESAFGDLAAIIIALGYLYLSTTVFLFGAQLDAVLRAQRTGKLSGHRPGEPEPQPDSLGSPQGDGTRC